MRLWLAFLLIGLSLMGSDWQPDLLRLPDTGVQMKRDEVVGVSEALGTFNAGELYRVQSLDGTWKMSRLVTSEEPFGGIGADERDYAGVGYDASGWLDVRVPLSWFYTPGHCHVKLFREGVKLNPDGAGGSDVRGVLNPYVKGWYRHEFQLKEKPEGFRGVLHFERIGYEAELFVNGRYAGRHHGDFVEYSVDVTELLKTGRNVLALRVLSHYRPLDGKFTRTYGALWGFSTYKAGIWGHVSLRWEGSPRVSSMKLTTPASGRLGIYAEVMNDSGAPLRVVPGVSVCRSVKGSKSVGKDYDALELRPGKNIVTLSYQVEDVALWGLEAPNLYYVTLHFRNEKRVLSARTERVGFRDFEIRGKDFYLNGVRTYLFFESAHSPKYGGFGSKNGHSNDPRKYFSNYKARGYNMLRTAHMPVPTDVLDIADEIGMMIYDEWSMAFILGIHEAEFEKNNLAELAKFIETDHNHASVVMWSLGNEVPHKNEKAIGRQLDKQVELVRKLDLQGRPICNFAGIGGVHAYGREKRVTDVLDLHTYVGISAPWTQIVPDMDMFIKWANDIYGDGKSFSQPYIISECVGGGWGMWDVKDFKIEDGDVKRYIELVQADYTWGRPGPAGYSGAIGLTHCCDRKHGIPYLQNRLGRRLLEQIRLDERISGFAPWFAEDTIESAPVWNQPHYPGLRLVKSFMPRQLLAGTVVDAEAFLIHDGPKALKTPTMKIELVAGERRWELCKAVFKGCSSGDKVFVPVSFTVPQDAPSPAQVRLTLFDDGKDVGRNSYDVTIHRQAAQVEQPLPVALLGEATGLEKPLERLGVKGVALKNMKTLGRYKCAVLVGRGLSEEDEMLVREWVTQGGFLLIMEPKGNHVPVFREYSIVSSGGPLVEAVVPKHPVFSGLTFDDLDTWSENHLGHVAGKVLLPYDETMLASKGRFLHDTMAGAALVEAQVDKGRIMVSAFSILNAMERNGASARLFGNMIRYLASGASVHAQSPYLKLKPRISAFDADMSKAVCVDLRPFANRGFKDEVAGDGKGGWTDQGGNDFRNMPVGRQVAAGVVFDIIDESKNNGKSCIILKGKEFTQVPSSVTGIPIGRKVRTLYFLHTAAYVAKSTEFARYVVRYEDGSKDVIPIVPRWNVDDWWKKMPPSSAFNVFQMPNSLTDQVSFFVFAWENPVPEKAVASLDFVSDGDSSVPILAGLTLIPLGVDVDVLKTAKPRWVQGIEPRGPFKTAKTVKKKTPVGDTAIEMTFPATQNDFAFAIGRIDLEAVGKRRPTYVSILFKSDCEGIVDVMIPEARWRGSYSAPLDLGLSRGRYVRVRLSLKKDFHQFGQAFDLLNIRNEVAFFNGKDRKNGYPRGKVTFEIADVRYEFAEE